MEFELGQQRERISATRKLWHSNSHETSRMGVCFFLLVWAPVACGSCSSETIGPLAHSNQHLLCVCACVFPPKDQS